MALSQKQIEAVIALAGPQRYDHFIKVAADEGCVWGLYSDGWALAATDEGDEVFPIWPAPDYALLCAKNNWVGFTPKEIDLDDLFENLLPTLKERNMRLGVFYTPAHKGVIPSFEVFEEDLREELSNIESNQRQ